MASDRPSVATANRCPFCGSPFGCGNKQRRVNDPGKRRYRVERAIERAKQRRPWGWPCRGC